MQHSPISRCAALLLIGSCALIAAADFVVFMPEAEAANELQAALKADPACAGLDVTVAAKHRVFETTIEQKKPALVLAPSVFVESAKGYQPVLQGMADGKASTVLIIASIDPQWNAGKLSDASIGLLQLMEKGQFAAFYAKAFPDAAATKEQKVAAKADDVFRMLGLDMAQVCLLSEPMLERSKKDFKGTVNEVARSKPIRLPMVFQREGDATNAAALQGLAPATLKAMRLDSLAPLPAGAAVTWLAENP